MMNKTCIQSSRRLTAQWPPVRLSHHSAYGPRTERFVKFLGNFQVVIQHWLKASFPESSLGNCVFQDRTQCDCPTTHSCSAARRPGPGVCLPVSDA